MERAIFLIRPTISTDKRWIKNFLREHWSEETIVTHNGIYYPIDLPGYIAELDGRPVGLITYQIDNKSCEIITLNCHEQRLGIGTGLINAVSDAAFREGCKRLWLITTNDNLNALRFYQKRGFHFAALHRDAVTIAREIKPGIPLLGDFEIPLRDEFEMEMFI